MKNYIPLKVEFCVYENLLCGRILQQDDRLIEQTNTEGILIKEDDGLYHACYDGLHGIELPKWVVYLLDYHICIHDFPTNVHESIA